MSTDLGNRIAASLRRQAAQIEVTHPLDAGAYRRLHQRRTRRSVLVAVTGVAAVGAGSWVVRGLTSADREPVADVPQVRFDLRELPQGGPPLVPWSLDGVIYDGEHSIEVPTDWEGELIFVPVTDGYLVFGDLIGTDGTVKGPLPVKGAPRVSADGNTLAWMETVVAKEDGTGEAELTTADAGSGQIRHQTTTPFRGTVVGFLGRLVVLDDLDGQAHLWNPATGEVSPLDGVTSPRHTNGRNLLTVVQEDDSEQRCQTVLDARRDFASAWTRCGHLGGFTQDGRYALLHDVTGDDNSNRSHLVDANTGEEILQFNNVDIYGSAVEPGGALLVEVMDFEQDQRGIVRCSLGGHCERATELTSPFDEIGPSLPRWTT